MTDDARQRAAETKRRRTREALVRAAQVLLKGTDWTGLRMEDVAAAAGVSAATAYNHYKTKLHLMEAVCFQVFGPAVLRAETRITGSPMQRVARYVALVAEKVDDQTLQPPWVVAMASQIEKRAAGIDEGYYHFLLPYLIEPLSKIIRNGQELGAFSAELDASGVAEHHLNGLLLRRLVRPEETSKQTADFILSQLLPALMNPTPSSSLNLAD